MNKLPLISIIVPAYNAEKYIERCIESVIKQTYDNWELVIVDDGSLDSTYQIARNYSMKDARIQVIHTENRGVSSARNEGIENMHGKFLTFVDADDELEMTALDTLYRKLQEDESDIVVGQCTRIKESHEVIKNTYSEEGVWSGDDALIHSLEDHPATYSVWGKLYKRTIIGNQRFETGRGIHEDSFFLFELFTKEPQVTVTNAYIYRYHITTESASRDVFSEKYFDIQYFVNRKREIILERYPELRKYLPNLILKSNLALINKLSKTTDSKYRAEEKKCIKDIRNYKQYYKPATKADQRWFFVITHYLYYPYKYGKMMMQNRIVKNASWLMAGKIIHMVLGFFIGLITARYLGPGNYGLINYASAYVTFFTSICTLGINSIIVKNFIDHPSEEGETLGTSIVLRLIASILSMSVIVGIVRIVDGNEPVTLLVVGLYSVSLLFQAFDIFRQWFQAKLLSKYYAISTLIAYLIASAYKIFLLVKGKQVAWFAISNALDYFFVAILLYLFYKKAKGPRLGFSIRKAKELLSVSCSYILAGLMTAIYASTDKLMLKQMLDESAVGYYALALSISSMWTFVLSAFIESLSPSIMKYHNTNKEKYKAANKQLYAIVFYTSLAASLAIFIIAPVFVEVVYGKQYVHAVTPLRIVVWYVAFSYLGVARNTWVVCEKKQKYLKYLYLGSAICNVVLNLLLIPPFGANGAAIASLITQISTIFIMPLFIRDFRPNVKMMTEAIMLKGIKKSD